MLVGYSRVSTGDQTLDLQIDALTKRGCEKIFSETTSGAKKERPELNNALSFVRPGDTLVVWRLDRLGRSNSHLMEIIENLNDRDIGFLSLTEQFDTKSAHGRFILAISAVYAEFERNLLRERTLAGLNAARARGKTGGRPPKLSKAQIQQGQVLAANPEVSIADICKTLNISRATYYRHISCNANTGGDRSRPVLANGIGNIGS